MSDESYLDLLRDRRPRSREWDLLERRGLLERRLFLELERRFDRLRERLQEEQLKTGSGSSNIYVYSQGLQQTLLSTASNNKYICQKEEKQQYSSVGTVRMFIGPRARH